jgi:polar amino acid transport system substrate-binding protein/glutamate/aspartate transport system substrate-binding protein
MLRLLFVLLAVTATGAWAQSESPALKRIKESGTITLGYRAGAAPFSYRGSDGRPAGYSVELCQRIAGAIRQQLKLTGLKVNWVPVTAETRFAAVVDGKIDMECGMATVTMSRQQHVDFSHLIFVDGGNMIVRDDAGLKRPADLAGRKIAVQGGTTTEQILRAAIKAQRIDTEIVRVKSLAEGLARLEDGGVHAVAGDRVALAAAAANAKDPSKLGMLEQDYSYEPYALVLPRGDPDFRLAVNRELARLFRSGEISGLLNHWFGAYGNPSVLLAAFVYLNSFPE